MSLQKTIFYTIFVVLLSFMVLSLTYFNSDNIIDSSIITKFDANTAYEINSNFSTDIYDGELKLSKFYLDNLNSVDRVYFNSKTYDVENNHKNKDLIINEGIFMIELGNYNEIKTSNFIIKPKSPGSIFIDNETSDNIKILSMDRALDVDLLDKDGEVTNTVILYPRMLFGFSASRNTRLKNSDRFRVEILSRDFRYIKSDILTPVYAVNDAFIEEIYKKSNIKAKKILENYTNFELSNNITMNYNKNNIVLYNNVGLLGGSFIRKYYFLFLNKNKKLSFFKKDAINDLNRLFNPDKLDDKKLDMIRDRLVENIKEIKSVDEGEYNNLVNIMMYYYKNMLKINDFGYIDRAYTLSSAIGEGVGYQNSNFDDSYFTLNKIYSLVDSRQENKTFLQQNLLKFLDSFFREHNINITNIGSQQLLTEYGTKELDYLTISLNNTLILDTSLSDSKGLNNLFSIYESYIQLNQLLINNLEHEIEITVDPKEKSIISENLKTYRETVIIEYSGVIENLLKDIASSFFNPVEGDELLTLKSSVSLEADQKKRLGDIVDSLFDFFEKNKSSLSNKNQDYNNKYRKYTSDYRPYNLALNDYSKYTREFDKAKEIIGNVRSIVNTAGDEEININKVRVYLTKFDGLTLSGASIKPVQKTYAEVRGAKLSGSTIDFDIYPFTFYRINNIYIDGKSINGEYDLDIEEGIYRELYDKAPENNKQRFEFSRFFITNFIEEQDNTRVEFTYDQADNLEPRAVVMFKRDTLLGARGDFSILRGYLNINYDDVDVIIQETGDFNVYVNNVILTTDAYQGLSRSKVVGIVNAEYVLEDDEHYFQGVKVLFLNPDAYSDGNEIPLFAGQEFVIRGKINILEFKDKMNRKVQEIYDTQGR